MGNCTSCGKKTGFFSSNFGFLAINVASFNELERKHYEFNSKLCINCNKESPKKKIIEIEKKEKKLRELKNKEAKKKIEEEENKKKKLIKKFKRDPLIVKFYEKYYFLTLSLSYNKLYGLKYFYKRVHYHEKHSFNKKHYDYIEAEKEMINFVNYLKSYNLSGFLKSFNYDINKIDYYISEEIKYINGTYIESPYFYSKSTLDQDPNTIFLVDDLLNHFRNEYKDKLYNFLKIILTKYGDLQTKLLFGSLNKITKDYLKNKIYELCSQLKTKEKIFNHIIENEESFIKEKYRYWYGEYMKLYLKYLHENKFVNYNSLELLKSEIIKFNESIKLKEFENDLVNPNIIEYSIEDIDLMSGFEFESFLAKLFKNMGYKVKETKLSGDQGADLILEKNKNLIVVQAKCYSGKVNNKAVQEVVASIKYYKAKEGIIVTNSEYTKSAIDLADSNDIRLIDRQKLKGLIKKYMIQN